MPSKKSNLDSIVSKTSTKRKSKAAKKPIVLAKSAAISAALKGKDIFANAQTDTSKTAALVLPASRKSSAAKKSIIPAESTIDILEISTAFEKFKLDPRINKALDYPNPTPVQAAAIPIALKGKDIIASAQTGTGKTAAFVLPTLHLLTTTEPLNKGKGPRALILAPTRELAIQVTEAIEKYSKYLGRFNLATVVGGMSYTHQYKQLSQPVDILVATPGRLIDHLERGKVDLSRLQMLIIDEADRMLDMGFLKEVQSIVDATPAARQTLMFSATLDKAIITVAQRWLNKPERVDIASQQIQHKQIQQILYYVSSISHKKQKMVEILTDSKVEQVIIFAATKRSVDELADFIEDQGYETAALHGDMQQRNRNRTLTQFRDGKVKVLVATDVAARGIDVPNITHVINFDLPRFPEDYTHRIGRTGRAGAFGIAISFATLKEKALVKRIERYVGHVIQAENAAIKDYQPETNKKYSRDFSESEQPKTRQNNNRSTPNSSFDRRPRERNDSQRSYSNRGLSESRSYGRSTESNRTGARSGNHNSSFKTEGARDYNSRNNSDTRALRARNFAGDAAPRGRSFDDRSESRTPRARSFASDSAPRGRSFDDRSESRTPRARSFANDSAPRGRSFGDRSESRAPQGRNLAGDSAPRGRSFGARSESRAPQNRNFAGDSAPRGRSFGDRSESRAPRARSFASDSAPHGRSFSDRSESSLSRSRGYDNKAFSNTASQRAPLSLSKNRDDKSPTVVKTRTKKAKTERNTDQVG